VMAQLQESHPYDEPQFLVYPLTNSSPGYAAWVRESTTDDVGDTA